MNKCACGCGELVNKTYAKGHHLRGKKYSEEHNRKLSISKKNEAKSKNYVNPFKGKKHSEETKERIRVKLRGHQSPKKGIVGVFHHSAETKKRMQISHLGVKFSEERRKNISNSRIGKKLSEEHKEKLSRSHMGVKFSEERIEKMRLREWSKETRNKLSAKMKIRRQLMVFPKNDTKIEIRLQNLLKELNIKFKTHIQLMGQPDIFIEPNICIFADGDYWHNLEKAKVRDKEVNEALKQKGYKILRFWEHDIRNNFNDVKSVIQANIAGASV